MSDPRKMELHGGIGTGAGECEGVPVVLLHIARRPEVLEQAKEDGDFDPGIEEDWQTIALTVRTARQLIGDLKEMVDLAIEGPPTEGDEYE
jgi:hypothetical protein